MTSYAAAIGRARGIHGADARPVGRPRSGRVVHLYVGPVRVDHAGKVWVPGAHPRPVCGWRSRRLAVLVDEQSTTRLGFHVSGHPLCRRCAHAIEKWAEQPAIPLELGPLALVLAAAAADDLDELLTCMDLAKDVGNHAHLHELIACAGQELLGGGHHGPASLPLGARLSNIADRMREEERSLL